MLDCFFLLSFLCINFQASNFRSTFEANSSLVIFKSSNFFCATQWLEKSKRNQELAGLNAIPLLWNTYWVYYSETGSLLHEKEKKVGSWSLRSLRWKGTLDAKTLPISSGMTVQQNSSKASQFKKWFVFKDFGVTVR